MTDSSEGQAHFDELESFIVDTAIPLSKEIVFRKERGPEFVVVGIYCSLLEQSLAILTLIKHGLGYHAYPLLRAQLEGFADFKNLIKDSRYLMHLEFEYEDSIKKLRVASKSGNPYLRSIAERFDLDRDLSEGGKRLKDLRKVGARKLEPKHKLLKAGHRDEYYALYPKLCEHSHGGLGALVARHIKEDGDDFEVVAFSMGEVDKFEAIMQTSFDILLRASSALHERFNTARVKVFEDLIEKQAASLGEQK